MGDRRPLVRIAHAYGNSRESLARALAADVDMIEVDVWFRGNTLYVRHARRLDPLPILYDNVMKGHAPGPFAVRLGKYYVRPDIDPLKLDELLTTVAGKKRVLLDVKGSYHAPAVDGFALRLAYEIRKHAAEAWAAVCGQTYPVLHRLREVAPELEVRYSIQHQHQWERFLRMMARDSSVRNVCMAHGFIDPVKARIMEENGVDLYCWTVDNPDDARWLVGQGVDGIISNDLELLASLGKSVTA
jgi:glycerophosphoryl diester phosphodiesterase